MSEGAKPVVDVAVPADSERSRKWPQGLRPDLAEVAAHTVSARRFVSRIGLALPVLFILSTVAVSSALGQPLRGRVDLGELGLWALGTALLLTPFLAALTVMLNARRSGLVWTTALVYSGLSGMLGLGVGHHCAGIRGRDRFSRPHLRSCRAGHRAGAGLRRGCLPRLHRPRLDPPLRPSADGPNGVLIQPDTGRCRDWQNIRQQVESWA